MLVTELPMAAEVRLEQPQNALCSMLVTESGMVTEVRLVQPKNAYVVIVAAPDQVSAPLVPTSAQLVPALADATNTMITEQASLKLVDRI